MAIGNIGQRIPLRAVGIQADGSAATFDGVPSWSSADPSIAEIREVDGNSYAYLLAAGSTEVRVEVDADRTGGVRSLFAVGLVVVNDPATEAQTVELTLDPAEDVPVEEQVV